MFGKNPVVSFQQEPCPWVGAAGGSRRSPGPAHRPGLTHGEAKAPLRLPALSSGGRTRCVTKGQHDRSSTRLCRPWEERHPRRRELVRVSRMRSFTWSLLIQSGAHLWRKATPAENGFIPGSNKSLFEGGYRLVAAFSRFGKGGTPMDAASAPQAGRREPARPATHG